MSAFRASSLLKGIAFLPLFQTSYSFADVHLLEDSALSGYSGQAGLAVDLDYLSDFAEFQYLDIPSHFLPGIHVGGHGGTGGLESAYYSDKLDNLRVNISLYDQNEAMDYGFSSFRNLAQSFLANGGGEKSQEFIDLSQGKDPLRLGLAVDSKKQYREGDLVIHLSYLDAYEKDGGYDAMRNGEGISGLNFSSASYRDIEEIAHRSVDFKYSIDEVNISLASGLGGGLSSSTFKDPRSIDADTNDNGFSTRLMSNFSIQGYLGPHDLHLTEIQRPGLSLNGDSNDTGITWNSYFKVTDLDVYLDIKGVQISDVSIHNNRGDLSGLNLDTHDNSEGNSSFGFAHAQREIYSIKKAHFDYKDSKDKEKEQEGIEFNTRFKGDIDIGHLSFGDTGKSIGEYYITDFYFNRRLTITPKD